MVWVKLDDGFVKHPKLAATGPLGIAMQTAALCYCNQQLTDGFIPRAVGRTLVDWQVVDLEGRVHQIGRYCGMEGNDVDCEWVAGLLVDFGVWEEVDGGWQIHDYLDYQPSRESILALSEQKKVAGKLGGLAKAKLSASRLPEKRQVSGSSKTASRNLAEPYPVPVPVPVPVPSSEPEPKEIKTKDLKPLAESSQTTTATQKLRPRDELWDAFVDELGYSPSTASARGSWNKALQQLRAIDATPDQIRDRCGHYRAEWPKMELSPIALVKYWDRMKDPPKPKAVDPRYDLRGFVGLRAGIEDRLTREQAGRATTVFVEPTRILQAVRPPRPQPELGESDEF